jgi:membrane protein DedA with SNARE-associated domain
VAIVMAVVAIVVATFIASSRLLRFVFDYLDVVAYLGLFVACWIGAGGAVVPIPGVRAMSWLMIMQQGAALNPYVVALVGSAAMVLGQTSYFVATRARTRRVNSKSESPAEEERMPAEAEELAPMPAVESDLSPAEEPGRRARYMAAATQRIQHQIREHGMATVFVVSALPSPMTTLTTTAAASSGMGYGRFFVAAFSGFLLLSAILAGVGQALLQTFRSILF